MSSFRPDGRLLDPEFIPATPRPIDLGAGSGLGPPEGEFLPGSSFDSSAGLSNPATGGGAEATWTPERIEALEQEAYERGVASAQDMALQITEACQALEAAAVELRHVASTGVASNRALLLDLAIQIAEKWVGEELQLAPDRFAAALDRAVAASEVGDCASIFLNPENHAALENTEADRLARWAEQYGLEVRTDASLEKGAFRLEGPTGTVDGTNEAIRDRLQDALSVAGEAPLPEDSP